LNSNAAKRITEMNQPQAEVTTELESLWEVIQGGTNRQAFEETIKFTGAELGVAPIDAFRELYESLMLTEHDDEDLPPFDVMLEFLGGWGDCEDIGEMAGIKLVATDQFDENAADRPSMIAAFRKVFDELETSCSYDAIDAEAVLANHRVFIGIAFRALLADSGLEVAALRN